MNVICVKVNYINMIFKQKLFTFFFACRMGGEKIKTFIVLLYYR